MSNKQNTINFTEIIYVSKKKPQTQQISLAEYVVSAKAQMLPILQLDELIKIHKHFIKRTDPGSP